MSLCHVARPGTALPTPYGTRKISSAAVQVHERHPCSSTNSLQNQPQSEPRHMSLGKNSIKGSLHMAPLPALSCIKAVHCCNQGAQKSCRMRHSPVPKPRQPPARGRTDAQDNLAIAAGLHRSCSGNHSQPKVSTKSSHTTPTAATAVLLRRWLKTSVPKSIQQAAHHPHSQAGIDHN